MEEACRSRAVHKKVTADDEGFFRPVSRGSYRPDLIALAGTFDAAQVNNAALACPTWTGQFSVGSGVMMITD